MILVIDLDSIIFYACYGKKPGTESAEDKTLEATLESIDFFMNSILIKSKAEGYIAFVKGKGNYRLEINPDYKSNRKHLTPPKYFGECRNYLMEKYRAIPVDNMETDDAVNITRLVVPGGCICSIDKDLLQLEGTHFKWNTYKFVTTTKEEAYRNFWTDMIAGQPTDGVPGLKGKGKAYADKLYDNSLNMDIPFEVAVYAAYVKHYENSGAALNEFYKTYHSLHILTEKAGFEIPAVIPFNWEYELSNLSTGSSEDIQ